jgi:hypothetical protein
MIPGLSKPAAASGDPVVLQRIDPKEAKTFHHSGV